MQFSTLALAALSIGSSLAATDAQVTVHVVRVGGTNGSLTFSPNNLVAPVGDMVQFQFAPANHSVAQSTFDQPCEPISANSNVTGIFSGFMPVSASSTNTPTYTILINSTTPMWIYCAQAKHCQNGMTMVINENTKANATRSLENFQALAAKASANVAPNAASNGTDGTVSASGTSTSTSTSTSSSSKPTSSSGASAFKASEALGMGGLLALAMALFI